MTAWLGVAVRGVPSPTLRYLTATLAWPGAGLNATSNCFEPWARMRSSVSLCSGAAWELGAGEFEMAITCFSSSAEIAERLRAPNGVSGCWVGIGVGEAFLGRRQETVAAFNKATTMVTTDTESAAVGRCTATLGQIADAQSVGAVGPAAASDPRSLQRQLAGAVVAFQYA